MSEIQHHQPEIVQQAMPLEQGLQLFRDLFLKGMGDVVESFRVYARMLDAYPDTARDMFAEAFPGNSPEQWSIFEAIGRDNMDVRLLDGAYAPYRHHLRRLPIATQRLALDGGVEVLTVDKGMLRVKVAHLTPDQAKQVFHGRTIRDEAAQRAWIEAQRSRAYVRTPRDSDPPAIEFKRDTIIIRQPGRFEMPDLIAQWTALRRV
jgi:hypothetical protein